MKTLLIILAIYVALDILTGVGIYAVLRINGWTPAEMGLRFRQVLKTPYHDLVEDIVDEVADMTEDEDDY